MMTARRGESENCMIVITVDPENDRFTEFTCSDDYSKIGAPKEGELFFDQLIQNAEKYLFREDQNAFLERFSKASVMKAISSRGSFMTDYRIMIGGQPKHVLMRIAPFMEGEKTKLLVCVRKWFERRS